MKYIFYIGSSDKMTKKIILNKEYSSDSILFLSFHHINDNFIYKIEKNILYLTRINHSFDEYREEDVCQHEIDIGTSEDNCKVIDLDGTIENNSYFKMKNHNWSDKFKYSINNNKLYLTRSDENLGWGYNHKGLIHQGWGNDLKGYIIEKTEFSIDIGTSSNNSKNIQLDCFYPVSVSITTENNSYNDKLVYNFNNNNLFVKRNDLNEGWGHNHKCNIYKSNIPKILLQTNYNQNPQYVVNRLKNNALNWDYQFFNDKDIIDFFKVNPLDEFPNIINVFNSIKRGCHKADLFRYYYLYLKGGVFIDSDAMFETNLDDIIKDYEFVTVIGLEPDYYFNGFIGTIPNNTIMYEGIRKIYYCECINSDIDYLFIVRQFKPIVEDFKNNYKTKLYKEKGLLSNKFVPTVDEENNDNIIFTHYFYDKVIPF